MAIEPDPRPHAGRSEGSTPRDSVKRTRCPTCRSSLEGDETSFPFCSERCRLADLHKWLNGDYTISRNIEERDLEEGVD